MIVGVAPDATVAQEEVFGPLLVVQRAADIAEALEIANGTKYGLSVSLFTRDINAALEYIQEIECGWSGSTATRPASIPTHRSAECEGPAPTLASKGPAAIEFFTETKTVQINSAG